MTFLFHSKYADIEVKDGDVFSFFAINSDMKHHYMETELRVLVNIHRIIYELDKRGIINRNEQVAYKVCQEANTLEIDYLIVEYIGDEDISPFLKRIKWIGKI